MQELKNELVVKEVEFNGANLLACKRESDGKVFVALRKMCEELGLDPSGQRKRIHRDETLEEGLTEVKMSSVENNIEKQREIQVLDIDYLPLWLTGIKVNQCRAEIRPYLKTFKLKAKDVLAKAFIKKDTYEVMVEEYNQMSDYDKAIVFFTTLKEKDEKDKILKIQEPKVVAYDQLMNGKNNIDMLNFSKALNIKGLGRNKLFKYLRNKEILMTAENRKNCPYEKYKQYFDSIEMVDDKGHIGSKTLIKPDGQDYILKLLKEDGYIVSTDLAVK